PSLPAFHGRDARQTRALRARGPRRAPHRAHRFARRRADALPRRRLEEERLCLRLHVREPGGPHARLGGVRALRQRLRDARMTAPSSSPDSAPSSLRPSVWPPPPPRGVVARIGEWAVRFLEHL